ncbi:MAG: YheC/YheD family protein [Patescibacteria group bacterium]
MRHVRLIPLAAEGNRVIRAPGVLARRELLVRGRDYTVRFGLRQTTARLEIAEGDEPDEALALGMSRAALDDLLLAPGMACRLRVDQAVGLIEFGPLVGVLVSPAFLAAVAKGEAPTSARLHARAARAESAAVYYFTADGIDWERMSVEGWVPDGGGGRWSRRLLPLPGVVYDRAVYGNNRDRTLVSEARDRFGREPGVKPINTRHYLDKWWLHQGLAAHAGVRGCLPETARYRGPADLEKFLGRHPRVFVKSFYGSGGMEVLSLESVGSGRYICHTRRRRTVVEGLDQAASLIRRFFDTDELIVQAGIEVVHYKGSCVDMRSLVQKDATGDWSTPQIMLRVAKGDQPMTNLRQHGWAAPYGALMPRILGSVKAARDKFEDACALSLVLARHIEHVYGPFGEIGLDLALDGKGRLWFLEANAKPDKDPLPFEEGVDQVYPQFRNIFAYAGFLAGFIGPYWLVG